VVRAIEVVVSPDEIVRVAREPFGWASTRLETPVWRDTVFVHGRDHSATSGARWS
jgi:hypothetical protein